MKKNAEKVSGILSVLANPVRLMIVCALLEKELCATELLDAIGTTKGNISQHLKLLNLKGFIAKRKDGNRVYFRIADKNLKDIMQCLSNCYCKDITKFIH